MAFYDIVFIIKLKYKGHNIYTTHILLWSTYMFHDMIKYEHYEML